MRTEQKKHHLFLLSIICCVLLFTSLGCGTGGGQAASSFNDSGSNQNSPPPPITDLLSNPAPPAPKWVSIIPSTNQVSLDWSDESPREDGFIVFRDGAEIARTARNDSRYTDTAVSPATTYVYRVTAFNKEGGNVSVEKMVTTLPLPILPPSAPTSLLVTADAGGISLTWENTSDNEDGFRIIRNGAVIQTVAANTVGYLDTTVSAGGNYCYTVIAFNQGGSSLLSVQQCATVPYPNSPPQIQIRYPLEGELVWGITRVLVEWRDEDDNLLHIRILVNGVTKLDMDVNDSAEVSRWIEVDLTSVPDGNHTITAEVYDPHNADRTAEAHIYTNKLEVEAKAIDYLGSHNVVGWFDVNDIHTYRVVRWPFLPLPVKVNPLLGQEGYNAASRALDFYTRLTGVTFEISWGSEEIAYSDCSYISAGQNPPPADAQYFVIIQPNELPCNKSAKGSVAFTDFAGVYQGIATGPGVIDIDPDWIAQVGITSEFFEKIVAHEIGHAIQFHGHETGEYLMYMNAFAYRLSPGMQRAVQMLYFELQPGDLLPQISP